MTIALPAMVAFVWHSLSERIKLELREVQRTAETRSQSNRERLSRLEREVDQLPSKLGELVSQIKSLELQLANHYPTKKELAEVNRAVKELSACFHNQRNHSQHNQYSDNEQ